MEIKIFTRSGGIRHTTDDSRKESSRSQQLMGDNLVHIVFDHNAEIQFKSGDYITWQGEQFTLLDDYCPTRKNDAAYHYDLKFQGTEGLLKTLPFFRYVTLNDGIGKEPEFSYTGNLQLFAEFLAKMLRAATGTDEWTSAAPEGGEARSISFSATNFFDALSSIATTFETEWWLTGKTLCFGRCETGDLQTFRAGESLTSAEIPQSGEAIPNRIYAYGSTRNITPDYTSQGVAYNKRLHLPRGVEYVDVTGGADHVVSQIVYFDNDKVGDIYPSYTGTISEVEAEGTSDDPIFYFKDRDLNFDPEEQLIEGATMMVHFESGMLQGRDFEVAWHSDSKRFEIINTQEGNIRIPFGRVIPAKGDKYIPWNIKMPASYIADAEQRLMLTAQKYVDDLNAKTPDITCRAAENYFIEYGKSIGLGTRVKIEDSRLRGGYVQSRVSRYSYPLYCPQQVEFTLSENVSAGRLSRIENKIEDLTAETECSIQLARSISRRAYRDATELAGALDSLQKELVLVSSPDSQFVTTCIFKANKYNDPNRFAVSGGTLQHTVHLGATDGQWTIESAEHTLAEEGIYYVYFECSKTSAQGHVIVSPTRLEREERPGVYLFLGAVVSSIFENARIVNVVSGFTQIAGGNITTERIQDATQSLIIDLSANPPCIIARRGARLIGDFTFESASGLDNIAGIDDMKSDITSAQNTAEMADRKAQETKARLAAMADDGKLSREEKPAVRQQWKQIQLEYAKYQTDASAYGVAITALKAAFDILSAYLNEIALAADTDTQITPDVFNQRFADYYAEVSRFSNLVAQKKAEEAVDNLQVGTRNLIAKQYIQAWNQRKEGISNVVTSGSDADGTYMEIDANKASNAGVATPNLTAIATWTDCFGDQIKYKPGASYVFKARIKQPNSKRGVQFCAVYEDGYEFMNIPPDPTYADIYEAVYTTQPGKSLLKIVPYVVTWNPIYLYDIQLTEGNKAPTDYLTAEEDVQYAIDQAQQAIDAMNDDGIFDIPEKQSIRTQWESISGVANTTELGTTGSYIKNKTLGTQMGISVAALQTAFGSLRMYLDSMALYTNINTPGFDRKTMAARFTAYYDAEIALTNDISAKLVENVQIGVRNLIAKQFIRDWNNNTQGKTDIVFAGSDADGSYLSVDYRAVQEIISAGDNTRADVFRGKIKFRANTQYSFKVRWKLLYEMPPATNRGMYFVFIYTDGTIDFVPLYGNQTNLVETIYLTRADKSLDRISASYSNWEASGKRNRALIYDIQLTEGNKAPTGYLTAEEDVATHIEQVKAELDHIASDSSLTPSEKQQVSNEWARIENEYWSLLANANAYGAPTDPYTHTYDQLRYYITPLLSNMEVTSDIIGSEFRKLFSDYYLAASNLSDTIDEMVNDGIKSSEYLKQVMQDGSTEVKGGLMLTNVLLMKNNAGEVTAGVSGLQKDDVPFWSGADYLNRKKAVFRVHSDGSLYATRGTIGIMQVKNESVEVSDAAAGSSNKIILSPTAIKSVSQVIDALDIPGETTIVPVTALTTSNASYVSDHKNSGQFRCGAGVEMSGQITGTMRAVSGAGVSVKVELVNMTTNTTDVIYRQSTGDAGSGSVQINRKVTHRFTNPVTQPFYIRVTVEASSSGTLGSSASVSINELTFSFEKDIRKNLIAPNGIAVVQGSTNYMVSTGDIFEVRLGNGGLKIENGNVYKRDTLSGGWAPI